MTAAFLDFADTAELSRAIERNEAPRPTGMRGTGRRREPVWSRLACETFVAVRHHIDIENDAERIEALL